MKPFVGARKLVTRPATMTIEIKCGMYVIVWINFVNQSFLTSLRRRASIIGAGNAKIRPYKLITAVFIKFLKK
ncbi:hypothetical protein D3C85_1923560 [compost metagenome]